MNETFRGRILFEMKLSDSPELTLTEDQVKGFDSVFDSLPSEMKRVLTLKFGENISYNKISRMLGKSTTYCCKLGRKGIEELRNKSDVILYGYQGYRDYLAKEVAELYGECQAKLCTILPSVLFEVCYKNGFDTVGKLIGLITDHPYDWNLFLKNVGEVRRRAIEDCLVEAGLLNLRCPRITRAKCRRNRISREEKIQFLESLETEDTDLVKAIIKDVMRSE